MTDGCALTTPPQPQVAHHLQVERYMNIGFGCYMTAIYYIYNYVRISLYIIYIYMT